VTVGDAKRARDRSPAYRHRGDGSPLLGLTLDALFRETVRRHGGGEAVVGRPQGRRLGYRELDAEVQRVARGLLALGLGRGSRVGIWATDCIEWLLLQLATARVGAILVNVNPAYRSAELEHAMRLARVEALVAIPRFRTSDYPALLAELCPEIDEQGASAVSPERLPDLKRLVIVDPLDPGGSVRPGRAWTTWTELLQAGEGLDDGAVEALARTLDPDDPINIQFTSGTTGFPKGVLLTHHNIVNNARACGEALGFSSADRLCVPVPFYHCFGMVVSNLACVAHGATLVVPAEHFDPEATLDAIETERCTAVHGVPTMFIELLESQSGRCRDLSSLRTGIMAGAPCPPELVRRVVEDLGCRELLIGYGQTEASPVTHVTTTGDSFEHRVETVGLNVPHTECKIVDVSTGALLMTGEQGEVCFRGYHVMAGYCESEEATRKAIDPAGWLHSGDLGVMDEDGYLRITGRLKDLIIRGGENIYPAEIEAFYYTHPQVAEIAVFGVSDPHLGEEVAAFVKLHGGVETDPDSLREFARERISHFKIPRYIWLVDDFPMTVTGKVQKFRMRELAEARLGAERVHEPA
jgi:fatty-acyl-CoA synthase